MSTEKAFSKMFQQNKYKIKKLKLPVKNIIQNEGGIKHYYSYRKEQLGEKGWPVFAMLPFLGETLLKSMDLQAGRDLA